MTRSSAGITIITVLAFGVASTSILLPFIALVCKFPLNLIWPDLVACLLLVTALYFFRNYAIFSCSSPPTCSGFS